jgi:hypothetical protein
MVIKLDKAGWHSRGMLFFELNRRILNRPARTPQDAKAAKVKCAMGKRNHFFAFPLAALAPLGVLAGRFNALNYFRTG